MNPSSNINLPYSQTTNIFFNEKTIDNAALIDSLHPEKRDYCEITLSKKILLPQKKGELGRSESDRYYQDIQNLANNQELQIDNNSDDDIEPIISTDDERFQDENIKTINIYNWENDLLLSDDSEEETLPPNSSLTKANLYIHQNEDHNPNTWGYVNTQTKQNKPRVSSIRSQCSLSFMSPNISPETLYTSLHPISIKEKTPFYFDLNDPGFIYIPQQPTISEANNNSLSIYKSKLERPISIVHVKVPYFIPRLSNPTLSYNKTLLFSNINKCKFNYHKPAIDSKRHSMKVCYTSNTILTPSNQPLNEPEDLSVLNSSIILVEYMEPFPPLLLEAAMPIQLIYWYQKIHDDDASDEFNVDTKDPNSENYTVINLKSNQKAPFMGQLKPGKSMLTLCNNFFNTPICNRTQSIKKHDYLLIWNTNSSNTCYIRPLPYVYLAGKTEPKQIINIPDRCEPIEFTNPSFSYLLSKFKNLLKTLDNKSTIDIEDACKQYSALLGLVNLYNSGVRITFDILQDKSNVGKINDLLHGFYTALIRRRNNFYKSDDNERKNICETCVTNQVEYESLQYIVSVISKELQVCQFIVDRVDRTPWCQTNNYVKAIIENNMLLSLTGVNRSDERSMMEDYGEDYIYFKIVTYRTPKKTQETVKATKKDSEVDIRAQKNTYMKDLLKKYSNLTNSVINQMKKQELQKSLGKIARSRPDIEEIQLFKQDEKENQQKKKQVAMEQYISCFEDQLSKLQSDYSLYNIYEDEPDDYNIKSPSLPQTTDVIYRRLQYKYENKQLHLKVTYSSKPENIKRATEYIQQLQNQPDQSFISLHHVDTNIPLGPQRINIVKSPTYNNVMQINTRIHRSPEHRNLCNILKNIVAKLKTYGFATQFIKIPGKDAPWADRYREVISNIIDLSTIENKIEEYDNSKCLMDDLTLLYKNTVLFNGEKSFLTEEALCILSQAKYLIKEKQDEIDGYERAIRTQVH